MFSDFSSKLKAACDWVEMAWTPNNQFGYPFGGHGSTEADFRLMDTDSNGIIDSDDDPFTPYWPGSDAVDWVGMSNYWWGGLDNFAHNAVPISSSFRTYFQAFHNWASTHAPEKPMMVPETAAFFNPSESPSWGLTWEQQEAAIKKQWVLSVFGEAEYLPGGALYGIKLLCWFNTRKIEGVVGSYVDWRVSSPRVKDFYKSHLSSSTFFEQRKNNPSFMPSFAPSHPTSVPSQRPSRGPSATPSKEPSHGPSVQPAVPPSPSPTHAPIPRPTVLPVSTPTFGNGYFEITNYQPTSASEGTNQRSTSSAVVVAVSTSALLFVVGIAAIAHRVNKERIGSSMATPGAGTVKIESGSKAVVPSRAPSSVQMVGKCSGAPRGFHKQNLPRLKVVTEGAVPGKKGSRRTKASRSAKKSMQNLDARGTQGTEPGFDFV